MPVFLLSCCSFAVSAATASAAALPTGTLFTIDQGFNGASSYVTMQVSTSGFSTTLLYAGTDGGIILGKAQAPGEIDKVWSFFTYSDNHMSVGSGVTDNGDSTLNMTNWRVAWSGIPAVNMGGDSANFGDLGYAPYVRVGTNYTLDYNAHVPLNDMSGFGGVPYYLHLEGRIISPVPEPGSLILLGTGIIGLIGMLRRRQ